MDVITVVDNDGNKIGFKQHKGRRFHPEMSGNISDTLAEISSLQFHEDDVLLCSYPKSGTHWVYNMICQLQHRSLEYAGSPFLLEFENLSQMNTLGSVRTYATHLTYPFIPEEAKQGNIKVINVTRNPKDVFCSLFEYQSRLNNRLFQGSFNGFFHQFVSDGLPTCGASWFTHVKEWEIAKKSNPRMRCLSLRYEDLIRNPFSSILKLAKFLEADYDENFLRKVEQTLTFENMRKEHNTQKGKTSKYLTWVTDGRLPIYRKGVIGDWKQKLTVKQNELFDEAYLEKMAGMPFDLSFVYE